MSSSIPEDKSSYNIQKKQVLVYIAISVTGTLFLWDFILFLPLKLYTTAIHECMHALATILTGGEVGSITLRMDGSGAATSLGGFYPIISAAGYVGCSLVGGLLISTSMINRSAEISLIVVGGVVFLLILLYADSYFSLPIILALGFSFLLIFLALKTNYDNHIAIFLGSILAVDGIEDVKKYVFYIPHETDAGLLAKYLGFEILTLPIALTYAGLSLSIMLLSIRYVLRHNA